MHCTIDFSDQKPTLLVELDRVPERGERLIMKDLDKEERYQVVEVTTVINAPFSNRGTTAAVYRLTANKEAGQC